MQSAVSVLPFVSTLALRPTDLWPCFFCWRGNETHTHTHTFNGPFSGTTRVSRYQEGKTNLDFTEARDSEWQWHHLGHMQVCTSLQTDNHTSIPPLSFLPAGCHSCRPTNSVNALKAGKWKTRVVCHVKAQYKDVCATTRVPTMASCGYWIMAVVVVVVVVVVFRLDDIISCELPRDGGVQRVWAWLLLLVFHHPLSLSFHT